MRQNAVSSAPQKLVATHRRGDEGDDARGRRGLADLAQRLGQRRLGGGGEELLQVAQHGALELGRGEDLAGDEQRDQRDREDREQQVVGDHAGEAGEVVRVGLLPELLEAAPIQRIATACPPGGRCRVVRGGYRSRGTPHRLRRSDSRPWPDSPSSASCWSASPSPRAPRTPSATPCASCSRAAPSPEPEPYSPPVAAAVQLRRARAAGQHRDAGARPRSGRDARAGALRPGRGAGDRRPTTRPPSRTRSPTPPRRPRRAAGRRLEETAAPEPIDEAAEEQAAAAEAAAIGGSAGNEYAGNELGEPATEAERPLAEAGEGVAEGQEQAEAELEENAGPGDEGMSATPSVRSRTRSRRPTTPRSARRPRARDPAAGRHADNDDDDISGGDWKTWSGGAVKPQ